MILADQFLFGYDDGHRLLAGSRELPAAVLVRLLGATDAGLSHGGAPLLTAFPLPETREYALCVTWSAPELPRAGAVWAHALLVAQESLRDPLALEALCGLPRRPEPEAPLDRGPYTRPLPLDAALAPLPGYLPDEPPGVALLERLARAAYRDHPRSLVVSSELGEAAVALIALWSAQWPELRARFAFRTRESAGAERSDFDLTVASQARGADGDAGAQAPPAKPWVAAVVQDARSARATPLRAFLAKFGPHEPPQPVRLRNLAALWVRVQAGQPARVRRALERHWPTAEEGRALKLALFGAANEEVWRLGERERVGTLRHSANPAAWAIEELALEARAKALRRAI